MNHAAPSRPLELLLPVHKALRCFMFDTVERVGALDVGDAAAVTLALERVRRLLQVLQHADGAIDATIDGLRHASPGERPALADTLYRQLNELVCQRLPGLLHEERSSAAAGPAAGGERQRAALRQRQLASLNENELCEAMAWLARALSPPEWAALHDDLRAAVSSAAYTRVLQTLEGVAPPHRGTAGVGDRDPLPLAA